MEGKKLKIDYVYTDILIIGGGSAGSMAAIRAKELNPDKRVLIFEKNNIKYSGSIPRGMDALNIVAVPGTNTAEDYVEASRIACEGVLDEGPSYVMAKRSWDLLKKIEGWGVYFPTDENGNYEILQTTPKGKFTVTMKEPNLKIILQERVENLGCLVLNRTMAVELLVKDGRIVGAIGLNIRSGEIIVCHAKAVIITAGGAARFGMPNNGYLYGIYDCPANSGDAYALAYKAGAELTGLEYTVCYYIIKDINTPLLYITLTRGAQLLNAFGEHLEHGHPSIKSMVTEHQNGKGYLRIRMSHLSDERISGIEDILFSTEKPVQQRYFRERGIDFRNSDIELGPTEFFLCGGHGITGVSVKENASSSVPGLFAAGDTSNVHRGHLSGAFVFGEIAAESALEYIQNLPDEDHNFQADVQKVCQKINRFNNSNGGISVEEFEFKTRRLITDFVTPPKNDYKLNRGIEEMKRMRNELYQLVKIGNSHDLYKAFEVENIITCAILSASASLERKESRWGFWHYRSDYPKTDPNYCKHVVVKKGVTEDDIITYLREPQKISDANRL